MCGLLEVTFSFQCFNLRQGVKVEVLEGGPLLARRCKPDELRAHLVQQLQELPSGLGLLKVPAIQEVKGHDTPSTLLESACQKGVTRVDLPHQRNAFLMCLHDVLDGLRPLILHEVVVVMDALQELGRNLPGDVLGSGWNVNCRFSTRWASSSFHIVVVGPLRCSTASCHQVVLQGHIVHRVIGMMEASMGLVSDIVKEDVVTVGVGVNSFIQT